MSQENVEAFKRGLEAGNRGDVDGLLDELHPESRRWPYHRSGYDRTRFG